MPVKGVKELKRSVGQWFADVEGATTEKALLAVVMTAAGFAKLKTPVDVATLINSQDYKVINNGKTGVVFYGAGFSETGFNYGLFLHENVYKDGSEVNWKPRKKKDATHHFLSDAFEDPDNQKDLKNIIINGYKL
jgi:hypothetical protein